MKKCLLILTVLVWSFSIIHAQKSDVPDSTSYIQIAFLLDASGSMQGLLAQAQSQIWDLYNFIENFERDSLPTVVEFSLFSYGHSGYAETGHINFLSNFTSDMDELTNELFSIQISGGEEYCGQVIASAVELLNWRDSTAFKGIFIAGNEPFDQGEISYESACQLANLNGILVNTIFCGKQERGIALKWQKGAQSGAGAFANINHNQIDTLRTPYDGKFIHTFKKYLQTFPGKEKSAEIIPDFPNPYDIPPAYRDMIVKRYQHMEQEADVVDEFYRNNWSITSEVLDALPNSWETMNPRELKRHLFMLSEKRNVYQQNLDMYKDKIVEFKAITAGPAAEGSSLDEAIKNIITAQLTAFGFDIEASKQ